MSINPDDRPWPTTLAHEDLAWPSEEQRILVPFREAVNLNEAGLLGASVAFGTDGELYLLHVVDPDEVGDPDATRRQAELKMRVRDRFSVPVVQSERAASSGLLDSFVDSHSITATVVDRAERGILSRGRDGGVAGDCHTVVGTRMDAFESPSSVLVPVARGPHSGLATRVAEAVARAYDCWLELFHVVPEGTTERGVSDARGLLDAYEHRLDDDVEVDQQVVEAPDPADAIIEHSGYHGLTVLGAPQKGSLRRFLFGSTTDQVTRNVDRGPVLTARRNTGESAISRWL